MQDEASRGPVIGAEDTLHATLAWDGERKQEDRAGASVALPKAPRASPKAGSWRARRMGAEAARGPGPNKPLPHLKQIFPVAFVNPLPAPGPAGNAQHRYLQSITELTKVTNN